MMLSPALSYHTAGTWDTQDQSINPNPHCKLLQNVESLFTVKSLNLNLKNFDKLKIFDFLNEAFLVFLYDHIYRKDHVKIWHEKWFF